jgi:DNA polymerase-3 subunit epsilon
MATQPKKLNEPLFTSGRNSKEIGFVFIENGVYKGFGFIPRNCRIKDYEYLKKKLIKQNDNRDARRIIRSYVKNEKIV